MSDRATLKSFFETNDFPTQAQFADLIDQTVNIADDVPPINFKTTLSSAQILALFTTPITLIPAQGLNTVINVISILPRLLFNATAYTIPAFSRLEYHEVNLAGTLIANQGSSFVSSGVSIVERPNIPFSTITLLENVDLVAAYTVGNPTLGNSTIEINVLAQVIQF